MTNRLAFTAAAALTLAACKPASERFWVVDNFSDELLSTSDNVADSYAIGSDLSYTAGQTAVLGRDVDLTGFTLVSSDPAVVTLSAVHAGQDGISAEGTAVGSGSAELLVVDPTGVTVHTVPVEVDVPDTVTLVSKLGEDVGSGFVPSSPQKICIGTYSAFEARFSALGRDLASSHVLGAQGSDTVSVRVEDSSLWQEREWMSIWPTLAGDETVSVLAAGQNVADVTFSAVDPGAVVALQVLGNTSGIGANKDDTVIVGAVGVDADGAMVLGVTPSWIMPDGTQMVGDELTYAVDSSAPPVDITVTYGSVTAVVSIAGRPTGAQDSSSIGCAAAPGLPGLGVVAAGFLALVGRRRRVGRPAR